MIKRNYKLYRGGHMPFVIFVISFVLGVIFNLAKKYK